MSKELSLISIIVPVYRVEKYLPTCVDSLIQQTYSNLEFILNDDGSCDSSAEISDEYALNDERFIIIHQTNAGQACARNRALQISNGDYISYVDSDDCITKDCCFKLLNTLKKENVNCAFGSFLEGDNPGDLNEHTAQASRKTYTIDEDGLSAILSNTTSHVGWCVWSAVYSRYIPFEHPFTEGKYYEDNEVSPKWLYAAKTIALTEDKLYFYRINPTGTTKAGVSLRTTDYLWALSRQIRFYRKVGFKKIAKKTYKRYFDNFFPFFNTVKQGSYSHDIIKKTEINAWKVFAINSSLLSLKEIYNMFMELCHTSVNPLLQKIRDMRGRK